MATLFHLTDTFNGKVIAAGSPRLYTVFIDGRFWGWVSGGRGSFRAFPEGGFSWGRSAKTRQSAIDAYEADKAAAEATAKAPRKDVREIRLSAENIASVDLTGWLLEGAEDLGVIKNVRLTRDDYENAVVIGDRGRDVLGLPSTVTAYKLA